MGTEINPPYSGRFGPFSELKMLDGDIFVCYINNETSFHQMFSCCFPEIPLPNIMGEVISPGKCPRITGKAPGGIH